MNLIDGQIHIWEAARPDRPWKPGAVPPANRAEPFVASEIVREMDAAGVARVVLVPPTLVNGCNDTALEAVRDYPGRFGVMGNIRTLTEPDAIDIASWRDQPGMLGVRLNFRVAADDQDAIYDERSEWFLAGAADADVPVMIFAPGTAEMIGWIARRHPTLRVIVDHLNLGPGRRLDGLAAEIEPVLRLRDHANVAVKISALPCFVDDEYPFPTLRAVMRTVVEEFGASRCRGALTYRGSLARTGSGSTRALPRSTSSPLPILTRSWAAQPSSGCAGRSSSCLLLGTRSGKEQRCWQDARTTEP